MVTTEYQEVEETMRRIKNFGTNPATDVGFVRADAANFRFSDILAAVGVAQLEKRNDIITKRRALASRYDELLQDTEGINPPTELSAARHTYQCYCAYIEAGNNDTRDNLIETYALHNTEASKNASSEGDLATLTALERNLLTLPVAHSMTNEDQRRVVQALNKALNDHR